MKKINVLLIIVAFIIGAWYLMGGPYGSDLSKVTDEMQEMELNDFSEMTEQELGAAMQKKSLGFANTVVQNENTKKAELVDVSGGKSSGTGYVLREDGKLYHYLKAELPDPEDTNKYEGWLVQQEPTLKFFSTGVAQKNNLGMYELEFTSDDESIGYDFVVVTEETVIDETPEKHIIEGLAK